MSNRNEEYYFEDIFFKVEDQLFKVPRHLFVKLSSVFRDMFQTPVPEGAKVDGLSDNQPLVLDGIDKRDFVRLLRCLYPLQLPVDLNYSFTLDEWQSVLKLASRYEMTQVKTLAIGKMEPLLTCFPSLQVQLAKAYNIRKWLGPSLFRLAQRTRPLDEEDVKLVGLLDSLKICALREKMRRCEKCSSCGEEIHTGGFGLLEIGHAFGISSSDLPGSVAGGEQNCSCSSKAQGKWHKLPNLKDPKKQSSPAPAAAASAFGTFNYAVPTSTPSSRPPPSTSQSSLASGFGVFAAPSSKTSFSSAPTPSSRPPPSTSQSSPASGFEAFGSAAPSSKTSFSSAPTPSSRPPPSTSQSSLASGFEAFGSAAPSSKPSFSSAPTPSSKPPPSTSQSSPASGIEAFGSAAHSSKTSFFSAPSPSSKPPPSTLPFPFPVPTSTPSPKPSLSSSSTPPSFSFSQEPSTGAPSPFGRGSPSP